MAACSHCSDLLSEGPHKKCGRCLIVYYCGEPCQREHWPVHKRVCAFMESEMCLAKKAGTASFCRANSEASTRLSAALAKALSGSAERARLRCFLHSTRSTAVLQFTGSREGATALHPDALCAPLASCVQISPWVPSGMRMFPTEGVSFSVAPTATVVLRAYTRAAEHAEAKGEMGAADFACILESRVCVLVQSAAEDKRQWAISTIIPL